MHGTVILDSEKGGQMVVSNNEIEVGLKSESKKIRH
jgi:hypothetical protein